MIIVKFYDGTFAVRRNEGFWKPRLTYLSNTTNRWVPLNMAKEYAAVATYEEARLLMKRYEQSLVPDIGEPCGAYVSVQDMY